MRHDLQARPARSAAALLLVGTACGAAIVMLGGWWPTALLLGAGGGRVLSFAVLAGAIGSAAGNLPAALALGQPPQRFVGAYFLGLAARFVMTLAAAFVMQRVVSGLAFSPYMIAVGAGQAVFLAIDTLMLARLAQAAARATR